MATIGYANGSQIGAFGESTTNATSFALTTSGDPVSSWGPGDWAGWGAYGAWPQTSGVPFSLADDSVTGVSGSPFAADSLGIIDGTTAPTDEFFGMTDTVNGSNGSGEVSALWTFDISGATDLVFSVDLASMGDFEADDLFSFSYSVDGGAFVTLLEIVANEAASQSYTMEGGATFTLDDPLSVGGTLLNDMFQSFSATIAETGAELAIRFDGITDGGSEAMVFDNLAIDGTAATTGRLFISEYVEGSGNNKAIELYNAGPDIADLSVYSIGRISNGGTGVEATISLPAQGLASGATFVIVNPLASGDLLAFADLTSGTLSHNGDDHLLLLQGEDIVDLFGTPDTGAGYVDPGSAWESGGISTVNETLRRVATVTEGNPDGFGADASGLSAEWEAFGEDIFDGLGSHAGTGGGMPTITVSFDGASMPEAGGTLDGVVTLSEVAASDIAVTLASSDISEATAPASVIIAAGTSAAGFAITAVDDAEVDGDQTVTISASATGYTGGSADIAVTDDEVLGTVLISAVQGSGEVAALNGQTVTVQGVVVGDYDDTDELRGFYLQEESTDEDGDATTSEGIFVFTGGNGVNVSEGQIVTVTGAVSEYFSQTQISAGTVTIDDAGDNLGLVTAATLDLPGTGSYTASATYEATEGMLVTIPDTLTVSEYFQLARFGQIVLDEGGRQYQYSQLSTPDIAGNAAYLAELNKGRIILDDTSNIQNGLGTVYHPEPGFDETNTIRGGDTITGLTGVLSWTWAGASGTDAWRIRPTEGAPIAFTSQNARTEVPAEVGGSLRLATFNVLNYFTTIDTATDAGSGPGGAEARGADSEAEFANQTAKLVAALTAIDADIFGLIEIENEFGGDQNGDGRYAAGYLVEALNAELGEEIYAVAEPGSAYIGSDAIANVFIYNQQTVSLSGSLAIITDADGFDTSVQRPAIAQTFTEIATGESFTASVNHFKSKGSIAYDDADIGDGAGNNNNVRNDAAKALIEWLATDPTGSGDSDMIILGDLNSYAMEDPIQTILSGADGVRGTSDDYTNLAQYFEGDSAYSYLFDGQLGTLDYGLASESLLAQITGSTEWHINADEVPLLDYNDGVLDSGGEQSFEQEPAGGFYAADPYRASDHDPIIIGLSLGGDEPVYNLVEGTSGRDVLVGTDAADRIVSGAGSYDRMEGGSGGDIFVFAEEIGNGIRERDVITDFNLAEGDSIELASGAYTIRELSSLFLIDVEPDNDRIYVYADGITLEELQSAIHVELPLA